MGWVAWPRRGVLNGPYEWAGLRLVGPALTTAIVRLFQIGYFWFVARCMQSTRADCTYDTARAPHLPRQEIRGTRASTSTSTSMAVPSSASACARAGPPPPRRASSSSTSTTTAGTGTTAAASFMLGHQRRLPLTQLHGGRVRSDLRCRRRLLTARGERPWEDEDEEQAAGGGSFDAAVALFNRGEYHACHDVVEELWYGAEDPARTLLHGVLQCAVGFHHLFNQNHRGAMMELGEGLCKLRKLQLDEEAAFSRFRDEVAAVLQFLYRTQKELAACTDEMCLTMDGSPSSYQLLGNFAAGQQLYRLELKAEEDGACSSILFSVPNRGGGGGASQGAPPHPQQRVKLPTLRATEQHLAALKCTYEYT